MTFLSRRGAEKLNQKPDIQTNTEVNDGSRELALENKREGARSSITDIGEDKSPVNLDSLKIKDTNKLEMTTTKLTFDRLSWFVDYAANMKQLVVWNGTTATIKIGVGRVDTASYDYLIGANKVVTLPPFNFDVIYYLIESAPTGGFVTPILLAYGDIIGDTGISSIT